MTALEIDLDQWRFDTKEQEERGLCRFLKAVRDAQLGQETIVTASGRVIAVLTPTRRDDCPA